MQCGLLAGRPVARCPPDGILAVGAHGFLGAVIGIGTCTVIGIVVDPSRDEPLHRRAQDLLVALSFDWPLLVAAAVLVTLTATSVGYALAVSLAPMLAQLVTQVLVFFVMLFSPVTFPASQLPEWFQRAHDVLPVRPAADLLRAGLASEVYVVEARDLVVLTAWGVVGFAISVRALVRRP